MHNTISEPALQYGSATWVLREANKRRIEASDMRSKLRSTGTRKQLGTEKMVEEIEGSQRKWHNHIETMPLNLCQAKNILITLLGEGALVIQEEDGHNDSFSFRMGHDSLLELSEEEKDEDIKVCVLNLLCDCFFYQGSSCQIWVDVWCFHHKPTEVRR
jgi:hypothetical protein